MSASNRETVPGQAQYMIPTGDSFQVSVTFTRPANATNYTGGDIITNGSVMTFPGVANADGYGGVIESVTVIQSNNPAVPADLELWLYSSFPAFVATDNIPFPQSDGDAEGLIDVVELINQYQGNAGATTLGNFVHTSLPVSKRFVCEAGSQDIYGVLVVRNAYNPIVSERFTVKLGIRTH